MVRRTNVTGWMTADAVVLLPRHHCFGVWNVDIWNILKLLKLYLSFFLNGLFIFVLFCFHHIIPGPMARAIVMFVRRQQESMYIPRSSSCCWARTNVQTDDRERTDRRWCCCYGCCSIAVPPFGIRGYCTKCTHHVHYDVNFKDSTNDDAGQWGYFRKIDLENMLLIDDRIYIESRVLSAYYLT